MAYRSTACAWFHLPVARIFSAVNSLQLLPLLPSQSASRSNFFFVILFSDLWVKTAWIGRCSYISCSLSECDLFFRFGGGPPLRNVQSPIFRNPTEDPAIRFAFLSNPSDVLSISRCSCRLVPESFIPILHSGPFHSLFSY
jgi:hypothetical protein